MTASAVITYIKRFAVRPGERAVVFTNNDGAYQAAIDLAQAGATVVIIDGRAAGAAALGEAAREAGIPIMQGYVVTDVTGRKRITGVRVAKWNGNNSELLTPTVKFECDLLAMSGGWSPAVHLHSQSGGRNAWNESLQCFVPAESAQESISAGAGNGKFTLPESLQDGLDAGKVAAANCGFDVVTVAVPSAPVVDTNPTQPLWRAPAAKDPDRCPKQFIDFQNDTSVSDIRLAVREGYRNVEHVKRYTALGFGTDQGKLGNISGMAVLAECLGEDIAAIGTTTFRPAYTPVTFGVGAGENVGMLVDPLRGPVYVSHPGWAFPR